MLRVCGKGFVRSSFPRVSYKGKIHVTGIPVNTDRTIRVNRPDIIIKDSVNSTCRLIDMFIPSGRNIAPKDIEKKNLVKRPRVRNTQNVVDKNWSDPCGCCALGTIKEGMVENIKRVSERATVTETQKIRMLRSARILRKVLNV